MESRARLFTFALDRQCSCSISFHFISFHFVSFRLFRYILLTFVVAAGPYKSCNKYQYHVRCNFIISHWHTFSELGMSPIRYYKQDTAICNCTIKNVNVIGVVRTVRICAYTATILFTFLLEHDFPSRERDTIFHVTTSIFL